jgi:sec-independent protein translocase protein TatC
MAGIGDRLDEATMSFGDHLEELRRRILLAAAPAIPLALVLYLLSDTLIRWLVLPLSSALEAEGLPQKLQVLSPPELLMLRIKLGLIGAAVILAPWIVWQVWLFVRPGLYRHERRFVVFLLPGSALLTAAGACLLYFVMLPLALRVLVGVGANLDLGPGPAPDPRIAAALEDAAEIPNLPAPPTQPRAGQAWVLVPDMTLHVAVPGDGGAVEVLAVPRPTPASVEQSFRASTYVGFVLLMLLGIVIAFQMPLVVVLLGWLGLTTPQWLASKRRHALFVCGILAAILTPQDVVSMIVLLVPLYGLYELGILLLKVAPASAVAEGSVLRRPRGPADGSGTPAGGPGP